MKKLLVLSLLLAACSGTAEAVVYDVEITRNIAFTDTLDLDIFSPAADQNFPSVVLFHGGSWYGGDKTTLDDFAHSIAKTGLVVYNATYTVGGSGGGYPGSYEDIRCALSEASELSGGAPLTVVGYSAGGHLASTVVLSGDQFASDRCTSAAKYEVSGFVGLAGPYLADRYGPLLVNWFGTTIQDDPDRWALGSPFGYLPTADPIPFVLVHGDGDQVVQLGFSDEFDAALTDSGFDVTYTILEGADHNTIVDPLLDGSQVALIIYELASLSSN